MHAQYRGRVVQRSQEFCGRYRSARHLGNFPDRSVSKASGRGHQIRHANAMANPMFPVPTRDVDLL